MDKTVFIIRVFDGFCLCFLFLLGAPYYKKKIRIKIDHHVYYSGKRGVLVLGSRDYMEISHIKSFTK